MRLTQFLIFEICRECNLGAAHGRCPNLNPQRCHHCDTSTPMADETIVGVVRDAYAAGFRGLVGWHYYNEPLMCAARMFPLMEKIKAAVPQARFVLWTNGTLLPTAPQDLEKFRAFHMAWLTRYDDKDYSRLKKYVPATTFVRWQLDGRTTAPLPGINRNACGRVFTEMVFDFYGNVHLCCLDWRGASRVGNIHATPFAALLEKLQKLRVAISANPMGQDAPDVCLHCTGRHAHVAPLVADIARDTERHRADLRRKVYLDAPRGADDFMVLIAYRIPESRVREHFKYNAALYAAKKLQVILVVENPYPADAVAGARQVPYRAPMPIFSNPIAKNYGIRLACECGARVIVAADIDVVFDLDTLGECLVVPRACAIVPIYKMIQTMEAKGEIVIAKGATGVVSMLADDWREAHYNESSAGYGADDTLMMETIRRTGRKVVRARGNLWHLAHTPGTPQREFDSKNPRVDHWGRAEGFHPPAFKENLYIVRNHPIDTGPRWGLGENFSDVSFVLTHYKMPVRRLREWIEWNGALIERLRARAVVVSDVAQYDFMPPVWMRVARFPKVLGIFNLSATSNYGIRLVGRGIIAKTDPDIYMGDEFEKTLALVTETHGVCPQYRMADNATPEARARAKIWGASKGMMALHWKHWESLCGYNERMQGYGIEDGDCFYRAGCAPRGCDRKCAPVWHIAHTAAPQGDPRNRRDFWGRGAGINPHCHAQNMAARRVAWDCMDWGRAIPADA